MEQSSDFDPSQLLDSLNLIKKWNSATFSLLEKCERAMESESTDILNDLICLVTPLFAEIEIAKARCHMLPQRMKALILRRASILRGRGMNSLPSEVIGGIFTVAAYDDHLTALAITHANREWRRQALSTPSMWSTVNFNEKTNFSLDAMSMYLERSKEAPLRVYYQAPTPKILQASLPLLVAHSHRWHELSAKFLDPRAAIATIIDGLPDSATLPMLERLYIDSIVYPTPHRFHLLRLPAIRALKLSWPLQGVDFISFGPGLERISFIPSSLTGLESFLKLREFNCHVEVDLVIEQSFRLHLPCLERLKLNADHEAWAVVSQLLRAMASCSPKRLEMVIYCWARDVSDTESALDPPATLLSHLEEFIIRVERQKSFPQIIRTNAAQIIERSPVLKIVDICGVQGLHLLLRRMTETFPPNVSSLELTDGGDSAEISEAAIKLLEHRHKNGTQPLKFIHINQREPPSKEQVTRLKQLVDKVYLNGAEDSEADENADEQEGDLYVDEAEDFHL